ncbi:MAG: AI-2E family transporter [Roseiarcus sp.]|uniref:AI-2E family transporter n=2 Tax=Roseiarcus sp. TaxID=1969460 RepID=UPI003C42CFE3
MNSTSSTLNALLIGVIVVAIMFFAREVLLPLALAGILSFMLAPLVRGLQRLRLPRPLAVVVVVLIAFAAIFGLGRVLARQVATLAGDLPKYQDTISKKIDSLRGAGEGDAALERAQVVLGQLDKEIVGAHGTGQKETVAPVAPVPGIRLIPVEVHEPSGGPLQTLISLINPLLGPLATTMLIIVFIIFILIQREDLRDRLIRLVGTTDIPHMTAALDDAGRRLSRLFLTQLAINSCFGAAIGLGLWQIGVPSAFVWGVLAGILRFVPFIGAVLGLVFPLILAISASPGWSMALWTVALFAALEGLTGQVIEPVFEGRTTGLTPVAIILAATFWAWIWGPIGLVLATPLTVILVVLGRHVEGLKFFDILLGDQPALSESEALYQRILAHDPIEAVEHAKAFMTAHSLSQYCDRVVKPALQLARKDADRGALEGEVLERFHKTFESLFADIAHEHWILRREKRADKDGRPGSLPMVHADQLTGRWTSAAPFVSIGCHDCLDEAAATVIATLAQTHGLPARVEKPQSLTAAELDKLDLSGASLICLSCLDLRTPARIQYAARRVRTKAPDAKLMLGLWTATDEAVLAGLMQAVNADYAFATFHEAAASIIDEATGNRSARADIRKSATAEDRPSVGTPKLVGGSAE